MTNGGAHLVTAGRRGHVHRRQVHRVVGGRAAPSAGSPVRHVPRETAAVHGRLHDSLVALAVSVVVVLLALVAVRLVTTPTSEDIAPLPSASPQAAPTPPEGR